MKVLLAKASEESTEGWAWPEEEALRTSQFVLNKQFDGGQALLVLPVGFKLLYCLHLCWLMT